MYLWNMVIRDEQVKFDFTKQTAEKEKNTYKGCFETDQTCSRYDPAIRPIVEAAFNLVKALNIDLTNTTYGISGDLVFIQRSFYELIFVYRVERFKAKLEKGNIVVQTENGCTFTKEQFIAIFDFLETLKETNWFF